MHETKKDVLTTLQEELAFLERGGYRSPQQAAWRPQFIFEDSPTCLNFRNLGKRLPCRECALMEFVPNGSKQERFRAVTFLWTIPATPWIPCIAQQRKKRRTRWWQTG